MSTEGAATTGVMFDRTERFEITFIPIIINLPRPVHPAQNIYFYQKDFLIIRKPERGYISLRFEEKSRDLTESKKSFFKRIFFESK